MSFKYTRWIVVAAACLAFSCMSMAQSVDAFFGVNTVITKTNDQGLPKLGSGAFPEFGGELIFLPHNLGIGAQVAWRGSQANYFGLDTRPIFYTFNLVWDPVATGSEIRPDFGIGFGAESLRAYTGTYQCGTFTGCTDYVSSSHLALHAGVGVKVYPFGGHIFLRPAVDFYNIRHNYEYGVPAAWQVGLSLGYTLGPSS